MDRDVRARLRWVQLYEATGDAGAVCRRCGVSRPTLRKWLARYGEQGMQGLASRSRRPKVSPAKKVTVEQEDWILALRRQRKLGVRRIQNELKRLRAVHLALATIHKILRKHQVKPLKRRRRPVHATRYSRPTPGDRVQMDVCKIAPERCQFTAVDDCTRYQVVGLYPRRSATCTLEFIDQLVDEMPFPIQRIQTDRGREFFAASVQKRLMELGIKFRPVRPASPHLNGKVERAQKTDLDEFWSTIDVHDPQLDLRLAEWQHHYNWERAHGGLGGKTPMDRFFELIHETPFWNDVHGQYQWGRERMQEANYRLDLRLRSVKPSL